MSDVAKRLKELTINDAEYWDLLKKKPYKDKVSDFEKASVAFWKGMMSLMQKVDYSDEKDYVGYMNEKDNALVSPLYKEMASYCGDLINSLPEQDRVFYIDIHNILFDLFFDGNVGYTEFEKEGESGVLCPYDGSTRQTSNRLWQG